MNYDSEIAKSHGSSSLFADFKAVNDSIRAFLSKFGTYNNLINTLETN